MTHSIGEAIYLAEQVHVLRPSPGQVIETLEVDFPTRGPALRTQDSFTAQVARAHAALERGVLEASR